LEPSIMIGVFSELEPIDAIRRLADIGWRNFEFYSEHLAILDKREDPEGEFSRIRDLCEKMDLSIGAMHDTSFSVKPERVMRWAKILGVKWIVIHPMRADMTLNEDEARQCNLNMLREWIALAHKFKIGIAIENMHDRIPGVHGRRSFGSTPSDLLWLIRKLDSRFVGVCWDTCHAYVQGLDQYRAIKAIGEYLVHTHMNDNISTEEEQHLTIFEGKVDWESILKALREIDYKGLFNIEGGFSISRLPLSLRDLKLRYLLRLIEEMLSSL